MSDQRKTIWYCHHYAGSPLKGMSYRPFYLTQAFNHAGHHAFVIGASFHHLQQNPVEQKEPVLLDISEDVPFITLKTPSYEGNGPGRMLNMLGYASGFKRRLHDILAITGVPDVIIASSAHPFHYPVLEKLARQCHARLIFEVRDLWPLSLQHLLGIPNWHPLVLWLGRIERRAYQGADYVVSVLDNAFSYMQKRGLAGERYRFIPNGTSVAAFENFRKLSEPAALKIQALKKSGHFLLGYAGAFGKPNALDHLIDAMAILGRKNVPVHAVLIGQGNLKEQLDAKVNSLSLTNITFLPPISKLEIPAFLREMDALYLGWNNADIYQYGVSPNKVFDYMMAGKPIIESGGSPTRMVEKVGCGRYCPAESPEEIADCIHKTSQLPETEREMMGLKGQQYVKAEFDYAALARKYVELF